MSNVMTGLRAQALAGVCLSAIIPGVGYAQASGAPGSLSSSIAPAADASTGPQVAEVIVTAQRRSERLRDVPLSVTAQTGAQLAAQGVTQVQDLTQVVPGLKIDRVGAYTSPAIRGISTQLTSPGADANVAIYLDGVYQPNQAANSFDLPDISRVEVLKGPQGTLFGRNATGGAIQIFTLDPGFTTKGQVSATYGSFNERQVKGFIGGPLIADKLAASLSAYYDKNDGYYHDVVHGGHAGRLESASVRAKLLAQPTDALKVILTAFYSDRKDATSTLGTALNGNSIDRGVAGAIVPTRPGDVAFNGDPSNNVTSYGGSVRATLDQSLGTFTATASGTRVRDHIFLDADYGYTPSGGLTYKLNTPDLTYSGELNFASRQLGPFNFVTGLFAYYDHANYNPIQVIPPGVSIFGHAKSVSYAGYFEANYNITERLTAIAGIRYSYEQRRLLGMAVFGLVDRATAPIREYDRHHWTSVTPRFSLRYKIDDLTNVYFTYSQGFKSGAYNVSGIPFVPPPATVAPPVDPESVQAFEVGVKTILFDRLTLNAAAFYYKYKDQQVNAYQRVNGVDFSVLTNAASARNYGADIDGTLEVTHELSMRAGLSLLHARYQKFDAAVVEIPTGLGGNQEVNRSASGNALVRSPDWTLTLSADYQKEFATGKLLLSANLYHSDKFFFEVGNRVRQPAYTTLGARAGWEFGQSGVRLTVWGKNLTDETIIEGAFITRAADGLGYMPRPFGGRDRRLQLLSGVGTPAPQAGAPPQSLTPAASRAAI
jgi:iron complex outermembrane receptor protein